MGCSSTSKITNYPSKEEFYKHVNSSINDRDVNVVTNDSSFTFLKGTIIKDDSLIAITHIQEEKQKIPLQDIKDMKYYYKSTDAEPSAYIWLKNGKELRKDKVKIMPDSTIQYPNFIMTNEYIPIDQVKTISYKSWWQGTLIGVPLGFLGGAALGGIVGVSGIICAETGGMEVQSYDQGMSTMIGIIFGSLIGTVTGIIWGTIAGWDHIYLFSH